MEECTIWASIVQAINLEAKAAANEVWPRIPLHVPQDALERIQVCGKSARGAKKKKKLPQKKNRGISQMRLGNWENLQRDSPLPMFLGFGGTWGLHHIHLQRRRLHQMQIFMSTALLPAVNLVDSRFVLQAIREVGHQVYSAALLCFVRNDKVLLVIILETGVRLNIGIAVADVQVELWI